MIKTVWKALIPLLTAVASAGLAWCLLQDPGVWISALAIALALVALFSTAFDLGERSLPADPVRALQLMELHRASLWVTGAIGAALVIRVGLLFPADLKGADKELIGALSTGAIAFVTAMFASVSDDKADAALADRIRSAFQARYLRPGMVPTPADLTVHRFEPGSRGERLIHASRFEDVAGWDRKSRVKRAAGVAAELAGTGNT